MQAAVEQGDPETDADAAMLFSASIGSNARPAVEPMRGYSMSVTLYVCVSACPSARSKNDLSY